MAAKRDHGLPYRVWNQVRLAVHVEGFFQIYDELTIPQEGRHWQSAPADAIGSIRMSLYQSIIVHLDMITGKQGVTLYSLIEEAESGGYIDGTTGAKLRAEINQRSSLLNNVRRQRNNLVAHRSKSHTFREIREAYPVTKEDLRELSVMYYVVAAELGQAVPFHSLWKRVDQRAGIRSITDASMRLYD